MYVTIPVGHTMWCWHCDIMVLLRMATVMGPGGWPGENTRWRLFTSCCNIVIAHDCLYLIILWWRYCNVYLCNNENNSPEVESGVINNVSSEGRMVISQYIWWKSFANHEESTAAFDIAGAAMFPELKHQHGTDLWVNTNHPGKTILLLLAKVQEVASGGTIRVVKEDAKTTLSMFRCSKATDRKRNMFMHCAMKLIVCELMMRDGLRSSMIKFNGYLLVTWE